MAAKMMGRWRSGAPLARLSRCTTTRQLGADPTSATTISCSRRTTRSVTRRRSGRTSGAVNPRDADIAGVARIHRMIRRGTSLRAAPSRWSPSKTTVSDRGLMFAFVGAHLGRQFEFVQSEWMNKGDFFGGGPSEDPIAGLGNGDGAFDIPKRPLRLRLKGLPQFVVTRGGEYCFLPSLRALRWMAELASEQVAYRAPITL